MMRMGSNVKGLASPRFLYMMGKDYTLGGKTVPSDQIIDSLFRALDDSANLYEKESGFDYLEGLCLAAEFIVEQKVQDEKLKERLLALSAPFYTEKLSSEDIRRAFRLAVLKGMKDRTQANHQMTPDTVAIFMAYLVGKLPLPAAYACLDLTVGAGNLLTALINHTDKLPHAFGIDVDETLIRLAAASINLQQLDVALFHQDSLRPLLCPPVDLVIGDLPVGTYPDKENARRFRLGQTQASPFSHYLLIEQGLNYLKPSGFSLNIVPSDIFITDHNRLLNQLIKDTANIWAVLDLPTAIFKDPNQKKCLLLLQKKGEGARIPKQILLASLPSFSNRDMMGDMIRKINRWFMDNIPASVKGASR